MTKIILASSNQGKLREYQEIFQQDSDIELLSLDQILSLTSFEPEENATTYKANAQIKALAAIDLLKPHITKLGTNVFCLADDSGIEIAALNGAPGIYSGRYLREHGLEQLKNQINTLNPQNRFCDFVCSLVLYKLDGSLAQSSEAKWRGWLSTELKGNQGFGFDPLVIPEEELLRGFSSLAEVQNLYLSDRDACKQLLSKLRSVAELDRAYKNLISHRARALIYLKPYVPSNEVKLKDLLK